MGKGLYLWNFTAPVQVYVDKAKSMRLSYVRVKVLDSIGGAHRHNDPAKVADLFSRLRDAGISPTAWGYFSGYDPKAEADLAIKLVREYGPDEFVVNAERQFKAPGMAVKARDLMVRVNQLEIPIGVTSYRYPNLHREFPFKEFLVHSDFYEPQVYWNKPWNALQNVPDAELTESLKQLRVLYPSIRVRPIGRAYVGDGYETPGPSEREITQFLSSAKDKHGLESASFWSFDKIVLGTHNAPLWEAGIAAFSWGGLPVQPPPIVELTLEEKVEALWKLHHPTPH